MWIRVVVFEFVDFAKVGIVNIVFEIFILWIIVHWIVGIEGHLVVESLVWVVRMSVVVALHN